MRRVTEAVAKDWLRRAGLPVPAGQAAASPGEAAAVARTLGGSAVVKALIPAGRRGKAGAVKQVADPTAAAEYAGRLLGSTVHGFPVRRVLVEQAVHITEELYLGFAFTAAGVRILASRAAGVEIEEVSRTHPDRVVSHEVNHVRGLGVHHCVDLWSRAGVSGPLLPGVARLTQKLWAAFRQMDGVLLELNPVAVDARGGLSLVGVMLGVDEAAEFRHPEFAELPAAAGDGWREPTARELGVAQANRTWPGGAIRFTELDGNIGLCLAGGGAGLLMHDLVLAYGGRPANHTDVSPQRHVEKMQAVFESILSHPRVEGLLLCINYLQMARCELFIDGLLRALRARGLDPRRVPVVVRVFGPGEEEARAMAATLPGIRYLPRGTSMEDAVKTIVALTAAPRESRQP